MSPSGPRLAGRFGASLLSIGATNAGGFDVLGAHWKVMEERAAEFGTTADRRKWRLVGPMHIADTKEQAYEDVAVRAAAVGRLLPARRRPAARPGTTDNPAELADAMNASGFAVIGTVDDAKAQIQRLIDQSGGFGTFLTMATDWAPRDAMWHSYELMARYVFPEFQGSAESTDRQPRLGGREPTGVHERGHGRGDERGAVPPPGEGREGRRPGRGLITCA